MKNKLFALTVLTILFLSCKKKEVATDTGAESSQSSLTPTEEYYFNAKVNGENVQFEENIKFGQKGEYGMFLHPLGDVSNGNSPNVEYYYGDGFSLIPVELIDANNYKNSVSIHVKQYTGTKQVDDEELMKLYKIGEFSLLKNLSSVENGDRTLEFETGAEILYYDDKGTKWSSVWAKQTSVTPFKIKNIETSVYGNDKVKGYKITFEFDCLLGNDTKDLSKTCKGNSVGFFTLPSE